MIFVSNSITQTWLYRAGLFALALLPVAHLTSLGVMEMAGFLLFVTSAGLFLMECVTDAPLAFSRVRSIVALPVFGYGIITIISTLMMLESVDDQLAVLSELKWILYFFAFAYFFERFANSSWCSYLGPFLIVIALMGVFALLQFFFGWEFPRAVRVVDPVGDFFRVTGFFNVPQSFAGNTGMAVLFVVGILSCNYVRPWKSNLPVLFFAAPPIILGSIAVLLTLTRSAWLAWAAVLIFAAGRVRLTWSFFAAFLMACCLAQIVQSNGIIAARLLSDTGHHQASIEQRIEIWQANWQMLTDYPLLGVGPEKNIERIDEYYDSTALHRRIASAHNNVLEVATTRGIFAAVSYCLVAAYFLITALRLANSSDAGVLVSAVATGSLYAQVYFHILGIVDNNFFDREAKNLIIFVWALTSAASIRRHKSTSGKCAF